MSREEGLVGDPLAPPLWGIAPNNCRLVLVQRRVQPLQKAEGGREGGRSGKMPSPQGAAR